MFCVFQPILSVYVCTLFEYYTQTIQWNEITCKTVLFAMGKLRNQGTVPARTLPLAVISSVSYVPFTQVTIQPGKERVMEGGRECCQLPMTTPVYLLEPVAAGFSFCISYC